jgi:hypothetical protein
MAYDQEMDNWLGRMTGGSASPPQNAFGVVSNVGPQAGPVTRVPIEAAARAGDILGAPAPPAADTANDFRMQRAAPAGGMLSAQPLQGAMAQPMPAGAFRHGEGDLAPLPELRPHIESTTRDLSIDPRFLPVTLALESAGGRNLGSRGNPGQFDAATAASVGLPDAVGNGPTSVRATGALAVKNSAGLAKSLGRDPTLPEVYLAHQQGLGGARSLLINSELPVTQVLSRAAVEGNLPPSMKGMSGSITAGQFAQLQMNRWLRAAQSIGLDK